MSSEEAIHKFIGEFAFLSNYYNAPIRYMGEDYANAESAFQAMKCANPADRRAFQYDCPPNIAKRMGRTVTLRPDWEQVKEGIMEEIVRVKFAQHPDLMEKLLSTGDAILVEGNHWHDNTWGTCCCPKCASIQGENLLGKILMRIRDSSL